MLKIQGAFRLTTIDTNAVNRQVGDAVKKAFKTAMTAYVQALADNSSRYTGQTFATYNLVAKTFGVPFLPQTPINEDAAHMELLDKYRKRNLGSVTIVDTNGYYGMVFTANIEQIYSNEFGVNTLPSPPAKVLQPWHALEKAASVFDTAFAAAYSHFQPNLDDILSVTEITVGSGGERNVHKLR